MSGRSWTEAEDGHLRDHYVATGTVACATALGRSVQSVRSRVQRLGLNQRQPRWTPAEDAKLAMMWGVHPIEAIAASIGRTIEGVYRRAELLDMGLGCPQGHETIHQAARRTGYADATLVGILRWAHVRIDRAWTRKGSKVVTRGPRNRVVETADVDDAVARWCATEPLACAAERLGVSASLLARLAEEAIARGDVRIPPRPRGYRKHWRIASVLCDELVRAFLDSETLASAARRVGRDKSVLSRALRAAGIPFGRGVRLSPADVDRVSASMPNQRRRKAASPIARAA
jgi:hypothetical protein